MFWEIGLIGAEWWSAGGKTQDSIFNQSMDAPYLIATGGGGGGGERQCSTWLKNTQSWQILASVSCLKIIRIQIKIEKLLAVKLCL